MYLLTALGSKQKHRMPCSPWGSAVFAGSFSNQGIEKMVIVCCSIFLFACALPPFFCCWWQLSLFYCHGHCLLIFLLYHIFVFLSFLFNVQTIGRFHLMFFWDWPFIDTTYASILSCGMLVDPSPCRWNEHSAEVTDIKKLILFVRKSYGWIDTTIFLFSWAEQYLILFYLVFMRFFP